MSRVHAITKSVDAVVVTAGVAQAIWTPASGRRFVLLGWELSCSAAAAAIFKDGTTTMHRTAKVAIDTPTRAPQDYEYRSAAVDNALNLDVSANATVSGFVFGYEY